jgi:phosphoribosylanthranilate isomerase
MGLIQLKICGLTKADEAASVARLGCNAIGVIAVPSSPRYLPAADRAPLWTAVASANPTLERVLVVLNPQDSDLDELAASNGHQRLQLHGEESPQRCAELGRRTGLPLWKALRVRSPDDLEQINAYAGVVDAVLLDAWVPHQAGGSGKRLPLEWLQGFRPVMPWWLAGGITPANGASILQVLAQQGLSPQGLDASSGVEIAPGRKNPALVAALVAALA